MLHVCRLLSEPSTPAEEWRLFTGNEIGTLLGHWQWENNKSTSSPGQGMCDPGTKIAFAKPFGSCLHHSTSRCDAREHGLFEDVARHGRERRLSFRRNIDWLQVDG